MTTDYSVIACFDMEMTCWRKDQHHKTTGEIISIGVAELCLNTGKILRESHYYVKPEVDKVSDFCQELTGITQKFVDNQGRPLEQVLESIKGRYGGAKKLYAAWGQDGDILREECSAKGISSPIENHINVAQIYMARKRHKGGRVSMKKAMTESGICFDGKQHNALVDVIALARVITVNNLL